MNQFGSMKPGGSEVCTRCEALLMDVLDRTASAEDQAYFDRHLASCTGCSRMFMDAKRGGAWLEMLRNPRPEPPAALLERILTMTSGVQVGGVKTTAAVSDATSAGLIVAETPATLTGTAPLSASPIGTTRPTVAMPGGKILPFRVRATFHTLGQRMLQPRLAMTAAMAFFSIALTLNLTGVHVSELRMSDLKPSSIRKGIYEANAHVVRYYDNLRVVYELEARVHDLQRTSGSDSSSSSGDDAAQPNSGAPAAKPQNGDQQPKDPDHPDEQKPKPKPGPGTSLRKPLKQSDRYLAILAPAIEIKRASAANWMEASGYEMKTKGDPA